MNKPTHVFAYTSEGKLIAYDLQAPGNKRSLGGRTLAELQEREPSMQLMTIEDFDAANNAQYTTPPVEITHREFADALYMLPPDDSRTGEGTASFKWCERLTNGITWIFARVDGHYFKMTNRIDMKHGDIVAACRAMIKETA